MTVTYPLTLPVDQVQGFSFEEWNASSVTRSPFTGKPQPQFFEGDYWEIAVTFLNLDRILAQPVLAFRSALRGSQGTFVAPFPGYNGSLGAAATLPATPLVRSTVAAGSAELPIKDAPSNIEGFYLAGDILQVGPATRPHWHRVLTDVDTDSSGNAVIDVWPLIREGTTANDLVSSTNPLCLFRQVSEVRADIDPPVLHSWSFVAEEEF